MNLVLSILVTAAWVLSDGVGSRNPRGPGEPPHAVSLGRSNAMRFSNQNKDKRCGPRYYTDSPGDIDYDRACYALQLRLVKAVIEGDTEGMKKALRDGANAEGSVYDYYPPLHTAAGGGRTEAVRLLLERGVNINRVANFENTALNAAASEGHSEIIKVLLDGGADPCYKSSAGTAGDIAQAQGYKEIAQRLKAAEARKCK